MKVRVAIVLGWLCALPAARAAQPPIPPTPSAPIAPAPPPPPVPTRVPVPSVPPAATVPVPTPAAEATPVPKEEASKEEANGKDKKKNGKKKTPPPPIAFKLDENPYTNVTPYTQHDAKTEEGKIDVSTEDNVMKVVLTGGVGANVFLGCESVATQWFQLVQPFEITSSDDKIKEVVLAIDAGLVGFVRSKHKASACVQVACVTITPADGGVPFVLTPCPLCVAGPNVPCGGPFGAMNKDPLPTLTTPALPLGRYVLKADLTLQATATGFLDAHSTAIFSPEPTELDPWEREHDPYKGEDKAGYGFTTIITATPPGAPAAASAWKKYLLSEKKKKNKSRLAATQPPVVR